MTAERVAEIRRRLTEALEPERLEVADESHLHRGHPGARDGRGHFRVRIRSAQLDRLSRLARHRRIYAALGELMDTDIHALAIETDFDDES
ncbi:MAG: BolA family protein [Wenzhouxiangellaceae bacterium]|nr:BolA family protein [Wenzhouxiangellaceae bacterium]